MIIDLHSRGTLEVIFWCWVMIPRGRWRWVTVEIDTAGPDLDFRCWVHGGVWENKKGKNEEERQKNKRGEAEKDEG